MPGARGRLLRALRPGRLVGRLPGSAGRVSLLSRPSGQDTGSALAREGLLGPGGLCGVARLCALGAGSSEGRLAGRAGLVPLRGVLPRCRGRLLGPGGHTALPRLVSVRRVLARSPQGLSARVRALGAGSPERWLSRRAGLRLPGSVLPLSRQGLLRRRSVGLVSGGVRPLALVGGGVGVRGRVRGQAV
ncbi:hypothetical protein [Nocardiopsis sp. YSL2]|uniref:hypothetical protein n=1 Tax=Nocardiopsis sp. YSL2 TaxID=2939492 RepID=UPI0026F478D5|nr:hypothetical protein [Nocardiopsis sp. YSL2]